MRAAVAALQDELRVGRKPPEENLHLTLAFLDDQPEAVLSELHEALQAEALPEFSLNCVVLRCSEARGRGFFTLRARVVRRLGTCIAWCGGWRRMSALPCRVSGFARMSRWRGFVGI
ncbi:MAG: hypothetical protein GYB25_14515 [Rhodobacteraceae bacterium]|nr:hypothetical protein [Paracoccaceae bacterium]